jgi:hypothetical protein
VRLSRLTGLAGALALALGGLAGCTSSGTAPSSSSSTPAASAASTPASVVPSQARTPLPPAPRNEACYRLSIKQLALPTNSSRPTSCNSRHDTQTIYVGRLDTVVDGHLVAIDSPRVQRQLERTCPAQLARYLGGSAQTLNLSRFHVVWFSPTLSQSEQGADWFRCDVIAFGRGDALFGLPAPAKLKGALAASGALARYGLCGTAAPGARTFQRVICARRHSWRALSTIAIPGGRRYPGASRVRASGDATCKTQAQQQAGNSLKYQYGWEWPTGKQWAAGQHYGFCWVPA